MQRFSVSVDDELAAWIEEQADDRDVSKAKVIRDAVETATVTGLIQRGDDLAHGGELAERIESLETRVAALEGGADDTASTVEDTGGVVTAFAEQLEGRPPTTDHGQAAVVRVFELLLEDGPLKTRELREAIYPEFEAQFASANSMWQSTQRHFEELSGIEKVDHGKWEADPSSVVDN